MGPHTRLGVGKACITFEMGCLCAQSPLRQCGLDVHSMSATHSWDLGLRIVEGLE